MSRDMGRDRTQEVVGSIPISSTNPFNHLPGHRERRTRVRSGYSRRITPACPSVFQSLTLDVTLSHQEVAGSVGPRDFRTRPRGQLRDETG